MTDENKERISIKSKKDNMENRISDLERKLEKAKGAYLANILITENKFIDGGNSYETAVFLLNYGTWRQLSSFLENNKECLYTITLSKDIINNNMRYARNTDEIMDFESRELKDPIKLICLKDIEEYIPMMGFISQKKGQRGVIQNITYPWLTGMHANAKVSLRPEVSVKFENCKYSKYPSTYWPDWWHPANLFFAIEIRGEQLEEFFMKAAQKYGNELQMAEKKGQKNKTIELRKAIVDLFEKKNSWPRNYELKK